MILLQICTTLILILALIKIYTLTKEKNIYLEKWEQWEQEYWFLRNSEAINTDYCIHLSWLSRGFEGCIYKNKLDSSK